MAEVPPSDVRDGVTAVTSNRPAARDVFDSPTLAVNREAIQTQSRHQDR